MKLMYVIHLKFPLEVLFREQIEKTQIVCNGTAMQLQFSVGLIDLTHGTFGMVTFNIMEGSHRPVMN